MKMRMRMRKVPEKGGEDEEGEEGDEDEKDEDE